MSTSRQSGSGGWVNGKGREPWTLSPAVMLAWTWIHGGTGEGVVHLQILPAKEEPPSAVRPAMILGRREATCNDHQLDVDRQEHLHRNPDCHLINCTTL